MSKKHEANALLAVIREGWPSDEERKAIAIKAFAYGLSCGILKKQKEKKEHNNYQQKL